LGAAITSATYPLAVRAAESGDHDATRRQLIANATMLVAVLAPASLGIALTAQAFAPIFVGPDFAHEVATLTPWLCVAGFFGGLRSYYFDHAFQLAKRPLRQIQVTAVAAVVAIALGFALIPRDPALGGAIASAVTMTISAAYSWWVAKRVYPMPIPLTALLRIAAACAAMMVCVALLPSQGVIALMLRVTVGAAAYAIVAIALNVLDLRRHVVERATSWLGRRSIVGTP
jgi:O-antigen/teichoic acid export membrane protein